MYHSLTPADQEVHHSRQGLNTLVLERTVPFFPTPSFFSGPTRFKEEEISKNPN